MEIRRRILGLDVGDEYVGVAVSDPLRILTTPVTTLRRKIPGFYSELISLVEQYDIAEIVVGFPIELSGKIGSQAQFVDNFIKKFESVLLSSAREVRIVRWDERLSTIGAEQQLRSVGHCSREIAERSDEAAASYILEGYLEYLRVIAEKQQ